ncbi:hypothetical protein PF004_g14846 [Phytophthora fragariae]|uniref:Protein argonaute-2 n=1 Tax=Phytophthora fragariae TaxID=53985 RepID=A0A6G0NN36_9STRA|nr:hypothetical protein PF004_g14846 [Phytophthora fragariae]
MKITTSLVGVVEVRIGEAVAVEVLLVAAVKTSTMSTMTTMIGGDVRLEAVRVLAVTVGVFHKIVVAVEVNDGEVVARTGEAALEMAGDAVTRTRTIATALVRLKDVVRLAVARRPTITSIAAQVHHSPDHGQADAEWEGNTQPLEVKSDDPYVGASVALSCKSGVGSSGSSQRLKSNCYQVTTDISKCSGIFQYDVTIEVAQESEGGGQAFGGRPLVRPLLRQVVHDAIEQNQDLFRKILVVHNGGNALFTPSALPFPNHVGVLNVHSSARNGYGTDPPGVARGKTRSFSVRIRLANELEVNVLQEAYTNPRVVVQPLVYALNAVMKAGFVGTLVESKGNLYSRIDAMKLNGGRVLYKGHHQTVRLGAGSLVLNLDRVWREFYDEGPLLEVVRDAFGARDYGSIRVGDLQETFRLARAVKRLVVRVTHRVTRLQTVSGVSDSSAQATMINVDGNSISVEKYFLDRYHIRLRFPDLPPVNLGGRRPGSESWVPMELCEVAPDQPYSGPDRSNTASIRTQAVVRPQVRMNGIQRLRESFNFENDPYLKAFGLSVAERMESVGARVLTSPGIKYGNGLHYPKNGSWNLQDKTFVKPCTLSNWGVVICSTSNGSRPCVTRQAADNFVRNLCREAANRGIQVTNRNPAIVSSEDRPRGSLESWLTTCHDRLERDRIPRGDPQLIVVIKADDDAMEYQEIKRTMNTMLGIPSQCITAAVLARARVQVLANICLKINAKLGGRNVEFPEGTLPLMHDEPTILIGADVCYPKSDKGARPPISSVTASLDRHSSVYVARLSVLSGRNDFSHLPQMLWELFIEHYKHSRRQPEHVVYYRSGVSTSRIEDVVKGEMMALRRAFRMLAADYEPRVTFVVANKHHHVRLFVSDGGGRNQRDRSGNPVPGTIVDSGTLADPQRLEFFLMGHSGIQGTSVPTQYTVMVDENNLSADQAEELTYRLCYSYARCTRSVSIAPPLYYAQLAAEHALGSLADVSTDCSSTSSNMASTYTLAGLSDKLGGVMFFA